MESGETPRAASWVLLHGGTAPADKLYEDFSSKGEFIAVSCTASRELHQLLSCCVGLLQLMTRSVGWQLAAVILDEHHGSYTCNAT